MINTYVLFLGAFLAVLCYMMYIRYVVAKSVISKDNKQYSGSSLIKIMFSNSTIKSNIQTIFKTKKNTHKLISILLLSILLITFGMSIQKYSIEKDYKVYNLEEILSKYQKDVYYEETETKLIVLGYSLETGLVWFLNSIYNCICIEYI
ncbi:hypothetical protein RJI07_07205 [Mycoplasmatota bacterium WC30]